MVETKSGSLDRLIAIAGRPLNAAQERDETERILRLSHNPVEQRKLEQIRKKDAGKVGSGKLDEKRRPNPGVGSSLLNAILLLEYGAFCSHKPWIKFYCRS